MGPLDLKGALANDKAIFKGQKYRITILSERLVRLEYSLDGTFFDNPTVIAKNRNFSVPIFEVEDQEKKLIIKTKYFVLEYLKEKPFIGPKYAPEANLRISLQNSDKMWYFNHPEARNFKATKSSLDNKSEKVIKGLYSTDGFCSIDDSESLYFDNQGYLVKPSKKRIDTYLFVYRRDFGLCLRDYFTLSGYPPLIARYALGIWWQKDTAYKSLDIKNLVSSFNRNQIPLSAILLSWQWHKKDKNDLSLHRTGYTFDNELVDNPSELIKYLHLRGIKLGLNINPSEGLSSFEDNYSAIVKLLGLKQSSIPFNIFNKAFIAIYLNYLIKPLNNLGIDFYWLDLKGDLASLKALCYYHMNNIRALNEKRPLVIANNTLQSAHLDGIHYSGDTQVGFKLLDSLAEFNSRSANLGLSWWSHAIGGFKEGIEDGELYIRYIEFGCFSPIFRLASSEGKYYKREPWVWDIKTYTIAKEYMQLRQRLIPYIYTEAYTYHKIGLPIVQPLYYNYPEIYDEVDYKNEYYFGSELLVKAITKKKDAIMGRCRENIFLPKGTWYDFKTGKRFLGNRRYVVFYKDEDYPVFVQSGAIIPLAILGDNINDTNPPKALEIHIFPGKSNIYKLYEDDGISNLYTEGYYIMSAIEYNYLANNYTVIIHPIEGKSGIIPKERNYKIRFRNTRVSEEVVAHVNNLEIPITSYRDGNDFICEVNNIDTTSQLTINCKGKDIEIDAVRIINEDINSIINDASISTEAKEKISEIMFSDLAVNKKRIKLRKLKNKYLSEDFIKMLLKLLEYVS